MKELEAEMDNVRLTPHPQVGFTHPTHRPHRYAVDMSRYSSLPHLERINMCHSPDRTAQYTSAPHIPAQLVPLYQDQYTATVSTVYVAPSPTLTKAADKASFALLADNVDQASEAETTQFAPMSQTRRTDSVSSAAVDQVDPVSWATPAQPVPPGNMIRTTPATSLVPPAVSAVPALPVTTAPAPSQSAYNTSRHWQPPPPQQYPYPPAQYPAPPVQHYYPQHPTAPVRPPDNTPGVLEMVIASSYGIPKPRLTVFSSGRESDFLLLKKGLDSILGPHRHLSEDYKYQVLLDHLRFPAALQIAKRFINSATPYTTAMQALMQRYGQPRQLVQGKLNAILNAPPVKAGDYQGIEDFAAAVGTLVGMLSTMQGPLSPELLCGSHVDTLLTKLPANFRDVFAEYCFTRGIIQSGSDRTYTLPDLAGWLERKVQTLQVSRWMSACPPEPTHADSRERRSAKQQRVKSTTFYLVTTRGLSNLIQLLHPTPRYSLRNVTGLSLIALTVTIKNTTSMSVVILLNSQTMQRLTGLKRRKDAGGVEDDTPLTTAL
uniref:uncharacterized protein LOC122770735 n=1 Tax=Solea senegalensis TaxID=28829 RepID=UPI001CD8E249|nr:uncharacterized protein LOC122770735 [Solea senegalensis]XP_043883742.1 uncharacterized protein LOC122770735 [Solea senegalensis]